jgi:hypothetical protein
MTTLTMPARPTFVLPFEDIPGLRSLGIHRKREPQTTLHITALDASLTSALIECLPHKEVVESSDKIGLSGIWWPREESDDTYPRNASEAVEYIRNILQIPLDNVFAAVDIAARTYHGWKEGRLPRQSSLGRLWSMAHAIQGIENVNPNITAWFQSSDKAKELFLTGDAEGLVRLEFRSRIASSPSARMHILSDDSLFFDRDTESE